MTEESKKPTAEQNILSLLSDPVLKDRVFHFCSKQYSEENILFLDEYTSVYDVRNSDDPELKRQLKLQLAEMYDKYVGDDAAMELNIPTQVKKECIAAWAAIADYDNTSVSEVLDAVFKKPFEHIKSLVQTSVILPFLNESRNETTNIIKNLPKTKKNVVIVGGGFCGATALALLRDCERFNCILIDKKPYFEYTPNVIQALVDPHKWVDKISVPYDRILGQRGQFIQGSVTKVRKDFVEVNGVSIPFDYMILSSGSSYKSALKSMSMSSAFREKTLQTNYNKMMKSKRILIVGGGLVGVELSSEFKLTYPDKHVVLVEANSRLMKRTFPKASRKILDYLQKIQVEVRLEERVTEFNTKTNVFKTTKSEIKADVVYLATGIYPNTEFVKTLDPNLLNDRGFVKTNLDLTMHGYPNVFVGGDIKSIEEEKLAKTGIVDGFLIARNILNSEIGKPLICRGEKGSPPPQKDNDAFLTLGPQHAIAILRNTAFGACYPGWKDLAFFMGFVYNFKLTLTQNMLQALEGKKPFANFFGPPPKKSLIKKLKDKEKEVA